MSELKLASEFPAISHDDWLNLVDASLKGRRLENLRSHTADGVAIEPVYGPAGTSAGTLRPARANAETWTLTQRADMPDVAAANTQMLEDLENAATGISLVSPGTVTSGAAGVAITDAKSVRRLFEGIELDLISLRLDGGRNGRDLALLVLEEYKRRRLDLSRCNLTLGLDPLGAFALGGKLTGREELTRRFGDMFTQMTDADHQGPIAQADARVYHGAGCSEAQELGLALATGVEYLRMLEEGGIDPAASAPRISMLLTADADQFLTIAKLRTARLLWARMLDVAGLEQTPLVLHVETAVRMMSRRDPHVNMLRTITASFAAGVGGADSVTALPFTHAVGLPDGFARRMARNAQSLLLEETRAGRVIDAAAGSGHVEALTHDLAKAGWKIFQTIEREGSMMAALMTGTPQKMISDVRTARDKNIAKRKIPLTGVSEFPNLGEAPVKTLDMAVASDWAIGEPWPGKMEACEPLAQHRLSENYEALRDASDAHLEATGARPQVFLATLGTPADFSVRATWMSNLLAAGGIEAVPGALDQFEENGLKVACICSSDAIYATEAEATAHMLGKLGATHIMMAGKPGNIEGLLSAAGINGFVHAGQDVLTLLKQLQATITGAAA
jgi:methylmalonyl-CoA mutase